MTWLKLSLSALMLLSLNACSSDSADIATGSANMPSHSGPALMPQSTPDIGSSVSCTPVSQFSPANDDQFLKLAYSQFYGRCPDTDGYKYWMSEMSSGYPRLNVLLSFELQIETEAKYHISALSPSDFVGFLYTVYLNRAPDSAGQTYWVNRYSALGGDRVELTREFLSTPEPKGLWSI